jgi:hypothetical protein
MNNMYRNVLLCCGRHCDLSLWMLPISDSSRLDRKRQRVTSVETNESRVKKQKN